MSRVGSKWMAIAVLVLIAIISSEGLTKGPRELPIHYKHLLIYCPNINVAYTRDGTSKSFSGSAPPAMRGIVLGAFYNLPHLIHYASQGAVEADCDVADVAEPISSLTVMDRAHDRYWLAPEDVRKILQQYAPPGRYDSVHLIFFAGPIDVGFGWGGILLNGGTTTYDSLCIGRENQWTGQGEAYGEPILHEWLHGVTGFLRSRGYDNFPKDDLHGAANYGYVHSPPDGWMAWYRDYMQCKVWDSHRHEFLGISREAWQLGPPTDYVKR